MRSFMLGIGVTLLTGCMPQSEEGLQGASVARYHCPDAADAVITVSFAADPQQDSVVLTFAGENRTAMRIRSASGSRYQGELVEFWEHQGEAMVRWGDTDLKCSITTSTP